MLWLVAFLLTLAEDVFSQGKKETPAELHIYRKLSWSAGHNALVEELTADMNNGANDPWPALGKSCFSSN
jgi:hypothetical protein